MIVLGIDPGTARVGYGVIEQKKGKLLHCESGLVKIEKGTRISELLSLERNIQRIVTRTNPKRIGVEKLFFMKNKKTALQVAEARGIIMSAAAKSKAIVIELSPKEAKQSVTGNGNASKSAVAKMVSLILAINQAKIDDVSDALAIAIATANYPIYTLENMG